MICPKNFFAPTWRIKNSHVGIWDFPRGYSSRSRLVVSTGQSFAFLGLTAVLSACVLRAPERVDVASEAVDGYDDRELLDT